MVATRLTVREHVRVLLSQVAKHADSTGIIYAGLVPTTDSLFPFFYSHLAGRRGRLTCCCHNLPVQGEPSAE
jgi:hypothetical protein